MTCTAPAGSVRGVRLRSVGNSGLRVSVVGLGTVRFGQQLERMAGPDHQIFVVWYGSYQTFGTKCEQILQTLGYDKNLQSKSLLTGRSTQFYQPMYLYEFVPTKH